jgi:putative ABC transport system permease protein
VQVDVINPPPGVRVKSDTVQRQQPDGTHLNHDEVITFLRSLPGAKNVTTLVQAEASVIGLTESAGLYAYSGDSASLGYQLLTGRWFTGAGEAVAGAELLRLTGKSVGDTLTLYIDNKTVQLRIVGEAFGTDEVVFVDSTSVPFLDPDRVPTHFLIGLTPGTSPARYIDSVADGGSSGLIAAYPESQIEMVRLRIVIGTLTALLVLVSVLGVAYTVVLNTRERRRDLAIVKAVGMTPVQVVVMAVTSMAALGVVGGVLGLPGGIAAQERTIRLIGDSEGTALPRYIIDVYAAPGLAGLLLCGVVIAVLGALLPARRAAQVSTAAALHAE